ncbi:MAG: hypothetical protein EOO71_19980 [Myxococcaceae bacterium]|nr:MAG: hypothetical protein EOO71_19980 [Myxococcaceae bacterium]
MSTRARWKLPLGTAGVLALAVGAWVTFGGSPADDAPAPVAPAAAMTPVTAPPPVFNAGPAVPRKQDGGLDLAGAAAAQVQAQAPEEEPSGPYPADLEALRAKLPDNLYWDTGVPTKEPAELRRRAQVEAKWNALFGRVQSNEATVEEVQQHFEHRRKVSEDAISFATTMLSDYGDKLPSQDKGLLELSVRMHRTRLAELPRQQEEALARREAHAQRQREWQQGGGRQP